MERARIFLSDTAAVLAFGTTPATKVIDKAGTYLLLGTVQLAYNGATVTAETATLKLRRTNNTAADLANSTTTIDLPVATTLTHTLGKFSLSPVVYTTAVTTDSISIFGSVSAALAAGTVDAIAQQTVACSHSALLRCRPKRVSMKIPPARFRCGPRQAAHFTNERSVAFPVHQKSPGRNLER